MRLLITGIPGAGKTQFGEYLAASHGFVHRDLEDTKELARFVANPPHYLAKLSTENQKPVITWGFVPAPAHIELVRTIGKHDSAIFWFDGDRPAALRAFQKRGTTPEVNFYLQMYRIESVKAFESVGPVSINSFDERGGIQASLDRLRGNQEGPRRALCDLKKSKIGSSVRKNCCDENRREASILRSS